MRKYCTCRAPPYEARRLPRQGGERRARAAHQGHGAGGNARRVHVGQAIEYKKRGVNLREELGDTQVLGAARPGRGRLWQWLYRQHTLSLLPVAREAKVEDHPLQVAGLPGRAGGEVKECLKWSRIPGCWRRRCRGARRRLGNAHPLQVRQTAHPLSVHKLPLKRRTALKNRRAVPAETRHKWQVSSAGTPPITTSGKHAPHNRFLPVGVNAPRERRVRLHDSATVDACNIPQ